MAEKAQILISAVDDTRRAFDSVKSNMAGLNSTVETLRAGLAGFAGAATVGALHNLAKTTIDTADQLNKLSQKVGISVESLSTLKYAAEISDVGVEGLTVGLKKLSVSMVDATKGSGDAAARFESIGVAVSDSTGKIRATEDVLLDLADRFSKMEDGAEKTALAVKLFGKSGIEMIPLLNQGKAGIDRLTEAARRMGLQISTETAQAAEKFNDSLKTIGSTTTGLVRQVSGPFIKWLAEAASRFATASEEGRKYSEILRTIADLAKRVKLPGNLEVPIAAASAYLNKEEKDRLASIAQRTGKGKIRGIVPEAGLLNFDLSSEEQSFLNGLRTNEEQVRDKIKTLYGLLEKNKISIDEYNKRRKQLVDSLKKPGKKKQKDAAPDPIDVFENGAFITKDDRVAKFIKEQYEAENDLQRGLLKDKKALVEAEKQHNDMLDEQAQKYRDLADPIEPLRRELSEINELYEKGKISGNTWAEATLKVDDQIDQTLRGVKEKGKETFKELDGVINGLIDAFVKFAETGKLSFKSLLASMASEILKSGVKKMFSDIFKSDGESSNGGGSLWGAIGSVASSFFRGGDVPAFASGGKFKVGGSGGTDSQLVAFRASPDETVHVTRPDQSMGANVGVNITINNDGGSIQKNEAGKLGRDMEAAILGVVIKHRRPGGLLA